MASPSTSPQPGADRSFSSTEADERRSWKRQMQIHRVCLHVDEPGGVPRIIGGVVKDLSRGGALLVAEDRIGRGQTCRIEFVGARYRVFPDSASATVRQVAPGQGRDCVVRVKFHEPLEKIKRHDEI